MARVVVIGGGFGGLASALRLAKLGHDVTLVEERELGGALVPVTAEGFTWDVVAHTLVPAVVRDLFRKTGRPLEKELDLVQLDCVREHWFADGSVARAPGRPRGPAAGLRHARARTRTALARPRAVVRRRLGGAAPGLPRGAVGPRRPPPRGGEAARLAGDVAEAATSITARSARAAGGGVPLRGRRPPPA